MRLNKFLAKHTDLSRRKADEAISNGHVTIDGKIAVLGNEVKPTSVICLNGVEIVPKATESRVLLLNKPVGYVCSRDGQGSPTVFDLVGGDTTGLNVAGRLDKDSSGLVILTNDGELLNELTHPSRNKQKLYEVTLDHEISAKHVNMLTSSGVDIGDERLSKFDKLTRLKPYTYEVCLSEGRNRQIRRTFAALDYEVKTLHRTQIGEYSLDEATL